MVETMTTPATTPTTTTPTTTPMKTEYGKLRLRDPFEMFERFHDEMTRFWGQTWPFGSWPLAARPVTTTETTAIWTPRVDVFEKDGELVVKAELPGAKKEDIEVTLEQGYLVIRGQKKAETEVKEEHYYRMEQSYGSFYRRLALPFETTAEQVKATYAEGVLEIHVPKPTAAPEPAPTKVPIT